ncbi:MAG TPA: four helix bundle protein [Verrucomicrobiae bacterium]|nr:four helix bundle protein [Verrucomicrobiae bacterium]
MKNNDLRNRTKTFALDVIRFCEKLPNDETCRVLRRQLLRSGTSVGANYRAACRGRSKLGFIAKLGIVSEEADESAFWIELLEEAGKIGPGQSRALLAEANELVAIAVSSINTARKNR